MILSFARHGLGAPEGSGRRPLHPDAGNLMRLRALGKMVARN
jgi:hypothetical protein